MRKPVFGASDQVYHKPDCIQPQKMALFSHMQKVCFLMTRLISLFQAQFAEYIVAEYSFFSKTSLLYSKTGVYRGIRYFPILAHKQKLCRDEEVLSHTIYMYV